MILDLDAGNSRIKWRLVDETGQVGARGHVDRAAGLVEEAAEWGRLDLVRVCSVRSRDENTAIANWAADLNVACRFARVEQSWGPVRNQYKDVSRLGVDRWLAMVAAYVREGSACMIVDAGTAITVDVVSKDGLHLGGYILPGLELMRSSLEQNTAIRLGDPRFSDTMALGHSTDAAVNNGANGAAIGAIEVAMNQLGDEAGSMKLFVSGGDAELIHRLLPDFAPQIVQELVFEGLALVCPAD